MAKDVDDKLFCKLLKKEICWGMCYEVQEVREDSMDMELFPDDLFDLKEADVVCNKCKWYVMED